MCGIAGIVTPDRREAEAVIRRMVPTMLHRGPDDGGDAILGMASSGGNAFTALGFRRLAILDLSATGHQPMHDPESGNVLVFNGEIYNFADLRRELSAAGCRFRGTSDTEVLLNALGRWGEKALERIEGMYALAFHRAGDGGLLLARDPLGIKPLYVARPPGRLIFASEIRTVLASGIVPRDLDVPGITGMLAFGAVQEPRTVFAAVEEFPAGHSQWIGEPARRFWTFPRVIATAGEDAIAETRSLVQNAVRRHLVADVPVGVFLSAGIDSTIVAACAADAGASITAFTVGIGPRHAEDETAVAAETARHLGIQHEILGIADRNLPALWHDWIEALDSPSIDGFNTYLVTKGLADRGIKVGLSGLGADEIFGGYAVFRRAPVLRSLMAGLAFLPAGCVASAAENCLAAFGTGDVAEKLADVMLGDRDVASISLGLRRVLSNRRLRDLALHLPDADPMDLGPTVPPKDAFNVISRVELSHYMRNTLLRDSDANSMRHSLELRVPFLDLPLVTRLLAMPGRTKAGSGAYGKHLLREAFARWIPETVARRRKTGFTLPVGTWMRSEMRSFCDDAIASLANVPCLDGAAVTRAWKHYRDAPRPTSWSRPFALVVLGAFLRRHATEAAAVP
jgi:asparagine synthase (glutamine-hydrolysing)